MKKKKDIFVVQGDIFKISIEMILGVDRKKVTAVLGINRSFRIFVQFFSYF